MLLSASFLRRSARRMICACCTVGSELRSCPMGGPPHAEQGDGWHAAPNSGCHLSSLARPLFFWRKEPPTFLFGKPDRSHEPERRHALRSMRNFKYEV